MTSLAPPIEKLSTLARAPPVQNSTVPFGRPPGTAIADSHGNGSSRRRRGCSIEVAGHGIGSTNPLLDHPYHLDYPRPISDEGAHLVTGGHCRRRLCRAIVDPDMPTSARGGGIRPGPCQPHRPQPPIQTGRLHDVHHGLRTADVPRRKCAILPRAVSRAACDRRRRRRSSMV